MQKKIIALAIVSAMTLPALAHAAATVYGQANLSVDMISDGAVTNSTSANQLNSNTSRLGLKGSEDLGGGLSAIWQMETKVGLDNGTSSLFNRNTFLGLSSTSMGTVLAGLHDTPYKMSTRKLDLFGDGIADNRGSQASTTNGFSGTMMGGGHDARLGNVIAYVSPDFNGFSFAGASVFGAETKSGSLTGGSALSLAAMFTQPGNGPWYGALALQNVKAGDAGTGDLAGGALGTAVKDDENNAIKLGVGFTMNPWVANLVIEQNTVKLAAGTVEHKGTNLYLAGKFNINPTDAVKAAYTKRGDTTTAGVTNTDNATQFSLGYDHGMSATTSVYALYSKLSQNATGAADPSVFSLGMKHSF